MDLGKKISACRREKNMSQEQLAELVDVTRQTISKWELGETAPNILEAKKLSKIFGISLDELVGNDVKDIITEKVSNTEKLAGIIIKILKVLGILFILYVVLIIGAFIKYSGVRHEVKNTAIMSLVCSLDGEEYSVNISYDDTTGIVTEIGGDEFLFNKINLGEENNAYRIIDGIENYIYDNGGGCMAS